MTRIGVRNALIPLLLLGVAMPVQAEIDASAALDVKMVPLLVETGLLAESCAQVELCLGDAVIIEFGDIYIATSNSHVLTTSDSSSGEPTCIMLNLSNIFSVLSALGYYGPVALVPNVLADLVDYDLDACTDLDAIWTYVPVINMEDSRELIRQVKPDFIFYQAY